jgi:hypothetical protein
MSTEGGSTSSGGAKRGLKRSSTATTTLIVKRQCPQNSGKTVATPEHEADAEEASSSSGSETGMGGEGSGTHATAGVDSLMDGEGAWSTDSDSNGGDNEAPVVQKTGANVGAFIDCEAVVSGPDECDSDREVGSDVDKDGNVKGLIAEEEDY